MCDAKKTNISKKTYFRGGSEGTTSAARELETSMEKLFRKGNANIKIIKFINFKTL